MSKIGDIFSVNIDEKNVKFFQYITNDISQLNSDVIRTFKKSYPKNTIPDLTNIINEEIDFYAHCVIKWGVKFNYWKKCGNISDVGKIDITFRSSSDSGKPEIIESNNWWIWKVNEKQKYVGKLEGVNKNAELGSVIPPDSIVYRMKTGCYDFKYPTY